MDIYAVLPAYNERENLDPLLQNFAGLKDKLKSSDALHVVVVDDGSEDGSSAIVKRFQARLDLDLVQHPKNMGFPAALRTGLSRALELAKAKGLKEDDAAVVLDADNTQNPELLPQMAEKIREGVDVAIASRYAPGGSQTGVSALRVVLSQICGWILQIFFPVPNVRDYTSSYRMIRLKTLEKLSEETGGQFYEAETFVCACEFLFNLKDAGAKFTEVPLALRYDLRKGASKMNVLKTVIGYFGLMRRLRRKKIY